MGTVAPWLPNGGSLFKMRIPEPIPGGQRGRGSMRVEQEVSKAL